MSKTETKAETTASAPNLPFDPTMLFAASQQKMQDLMEQYAQLEALAIARARQAIETWAQLAQDALAYSAQLTAQARKLGLDAARKIAA
jgi:hypothetical protein